MEIKRLALDDLHQDPSNARAHGPVNMDAIEGSLRRFGQAEPLVVQKSTGRIIGGNGRVAAMRKLGWDSCEVVEVDVDDLQATALAVALNRTAELAAWDEPVLGRLLEELREADALDGVGYSEGDLDALLAELGTETNDLEDTVPEPLDDAVSRPGDIWVLGNHRLMCGDSSKPDDVDRLLAGASIHLVNTDPPFNVKVEPRSNAAIAAGNSSFKATSSTNTPLKVRAKDRPLANDFVSDGDYARLLMAWFGNIARVLEPGRCYYAWGGYSNCSNYPAALAANRLYFSQAIIWVKEHPVLTRKDFMGNHEWCFYGWREGAGHKFFGPNNATDVWEVQKISPQKMVHLTQKPIELAVRAIEYSSQRGENVLDLFGGSGSTLMGCEKTGRNGLLMEIDATYTDVIVRRWEGATKKRATLEATGQGWSQVAGDRT